MSVGGELGTRTRGDASGLSRRRVMRHNPLNIGFRYQLWLGNRHLVDQKIDACGISDKVLARTRVARKYDGPPAILDAIAIGGLDEIAVIDLEGDHPHAIPLVHRTVGGELFYRNPYSI